MPSALAVALAAFATRPTTTAEPTTPVPTEVSPAPSYATLPPLSISSSASSSSICSDERSRFPHRPFSSPRVNEHLAVLLPKHLWKPDALAPKCDTFYCHVRFSVFERRHHCRKCGDVFCGSCSRRSTPLLDTSNLTFLHPPRNVPLEFYRSPQSPITTARVCDDCWEQIHGCPTPRTPDLVHSKPIAVLAPPATLTSSTSSLSSSGVATPPSCVSPVPRRSLRSTPSLTSLTSSRRVRASHVVLPDTVLEVRAALEGEASFGELDAYPLRRASAICKATGGGRWEPKQEPLNPWYRIPGCKAPFELDMEREEQAERMRRSNPVVRDGEFQYRFPKDPEPIVMARSLHHTSTF